MNETLRAMKHLEERFVAWAQEREDIRMAVVVGSWARSDHPADEWSDLDIGFSTTHPERYLSSDGWVAEIANVWLMFPDATGVTRHVLFEGGLDAGLAPIPHSDVRMAVRLVPALRRLPLRVMIPAPVRKGIERQLATAAEYIGRGVRVILDKDAVAQRFLALLPPHEPHRDLPSQRDYEAAVSQFWFEAVWSAKHLRRGELWYAKNAGVDGSMKSLLLRMLEWNAWLAHGAKVDTWERGRFLEEWGDPRVSEELSRTFAHYDAEDVGRALLATMDVFRRVAIETGERARYAYPAEADARVTEWVKTCMANRRAAPSD